MTLPSSGAMSASIINVELGRSSSAAFDINGAAERALAAVPSGTISFSDFYGKTNGDPYYSNTKLIVHNDSASSSVITDYSPLNQSVSFAGSTAVISTGTYKFAPGSLSFPSGVGYAQSANAPLDRFDLNFTNWTWELWYYEISGSLGSLMSHRLGGTDGWVLTTSGVRAKINGTWSDTQMTWTQPSADAWHHIAWVKNGTTLTVFVDGTSVATKTSVTSIAFIGNTAAFLFGTAGGTENPFRGFIDDSRYTRDTARYTANFTPPTGPFPNY